MSISSWGSFQGLDPNPVQTHLHMGQRPTSSGSQALLPPVKLENPQIGQAREDGCQRRVGVVEVQLLQRSQVA
jgi:hypothetical protein